MLRWPIDLPPRSLCFSSFKLQNCLMPSIIWESVKKEKKRWSPFAKLTSTNLLPGITSSSNKKECNQCGVNSWWKNLPRERKKLLITRALNCFKGITFVKRHKSSNSFCFLIHISIQKQSTAISEMSQGTSWWRNRQQGDNWVVSLVRTGFRILRGFLPNKAKLLGLFMAPKEVPGVCLSGLHLPPLHLRAEGQCQPVTLEAFLKG